jgi:hypothetical protein
MKNLYSPENAAELSLLRSVLDAQGINYFVHNDHFGSLQVGFKVDLYNAKTIMVPEEEYDEAKDILDDFLSHTKQSPDDSGQTVSWGDRLRMMIEFLLFSWVIPGNKWKKETKK